MEIASEEGGEEMPLPLNSTYGGGHPHMLHHHHLLHHPAPSSHTPPNNHIIIPSSSPPPTLPDDAPFKKAAAVRYRECLKNHAAAMGGNATDGCGEFMPSGDDGTLEALTCSACACHRNFHRKDSDADDSSTATCYPRLGRKLFVGHHHKGYLGHPDSLGYHHAAAAGALISSRPPPQHQMIMSYNMGGGGGGSVPSESDEQEGGGGMMQARAAHHHHHQLVKKRFRTKFSQEQKEKMLEFAEKVGWKIQKQEEAVVQSFCQEIGVKRRVLKVWMHNNKHTLAKKALHSDPQPPQEHHQQQQQSLASN